MAIDKTKVASGPGTIRFIKNSATTADVVATFTGYENEFIKVTGSKEEKSKDLEDGSKDKWKTGQSLGVEVSTSEIDLTVCAAFETDEAAIDSVEIDWLNKNKTWTIAVDDASVELVDGPKLAYRATKDGGTTDTIASLITIAATA